MYNRSETSDHSTRSSASLNEEQFEDYGEGEDGDYNPSSPCPDDEIRINGCSDLGSSISSRHVFVCVCVCIPKVFFIIIIIIFFTSNHNSTVSTSDCP